MANAPPNNFPPVVTGGVQAGFPPGPTVSDLCKFKIPFLRFSFGFKLPFTFPPKIPIPFLMLGINCSLNNPLNVAAGIKPGGGRVANTPPDPQLTETSSTP